MIAKAVSAARKPDLAHESGKHRRHPVKLLAVMSALRTPAAHYHSALAA